MARLFAYIVTVVASTLFILILPLRVSADIITEFEEHEVLSASLSGHLAKVSFLSPALGGTRHIYIYTPPHYSTASPKPYPVIVLLHGSPGGPVEWLYRGNAHRILEDAIQSGRFPSCILAIPDGHGPFEKGGSEWADSVDGRCKMETSITTDLPRFLKSHYCVSANPAQWTLGGLSEGGYGAANLVVRHPDVYGNAIILSGEFTVNQNWGDAQKVFGTETANREANSPAILIRHLSPSLRAGLHFYIAVGIDDDMDLVNENESFVATCKALGVAVYFDHDPGKHQWDFWSNHFKLALTPLAGWLKNG